MRAAIMVLAGILAAAPAVADDKADVLAVAKGYADDFNNGDIAAASALCTGKVVIIDDFPPHVWQGFTACADWAAAYGAFTQAQEITEPKISTGTVRALSATGDRAYTVLSTTLRYKQHGKRTYELGLLTFAMQKVDAGWRITGWSWASQ